jgi:hypothetical protein
MSLRFSLDLSLHKTSSHSWSYLEESKTPTGYLVSRKGSKVTEGWRIAWKNGIAACGPFKTVEKMTTRGTQTLTGAAARRACAELRKKSSDYRSKGRSSFKNLFLNLLCLPLHVAALLVTLLTLPLYWLTFCVAKLIVSLLMRILPTYAQKMTRK